MSNWLTVLFVAIRSSARSAPISYTPPVKPPPPSTSAVLSLRRRRRVGRAPAVPRFFLAAAPRRAATRALAVGSSLTTLPMLDSFYGLLAPETPLPTRQPPAVSPALPRRALLASPRRVLFAGFCACLPAFLGACLSAPAAASAASETAALQADLSHQMAIAGSGLRRLRLRPDRPPGAVQRARRDAAPAGLGGEALHRHHRTGAAGPDRAPDDERARQRPPAPRAGVWEGNLYLRGGGDPTFGSSAFIHAHYGGQGASVSTLVTQLVRTDGIHHITGSIEGDETYFDSLRGEPSSDFGPDPFLEGTLSGLAFNRGAAGSERGPHAPAAYAAHELLAALKSDGVTVARLLRRGADTRERDDPARAGRSRRRSTACSR